MKEDTFSADRDAIRRGEVTDRKSLDTLYPVDVRLGANRSEPSAGFVAEGKSAGHGRLPRLVCRCAEDVVEQERADSPVHVAGGPFVGRAERHVGPNSPVGLVVDHQRWSQRIAEPDDGVPPSQ